MFDASKTLSKTTEVTGSATGVRTTRPVDQLFLVLEGARPLAGGARWSLEGVDEVRFRRASARSAVREKDGQRNVLTIKLPDNLLSGNHARLLSNDGKWMLIDDGSTNGTFVDGARVQARAISDGTTIEMGAAHFILRTALPTPEKYPAEVESANLRMTKLGAASLVPMYADELEAFTRIALSGVSILLLGESGTGKEVLANAAHRVSGREGPFVPVNCGALTATLMESQLFGHMKGSFSGALRDEPGFVRASDGGTLFLDEIGDLPAPSQAALLRVLETREVVPVGSTKAVRVNLRVVAATLKAASSLRPDLHARLAGYTQTLLPLRERMEDLGLVLGELLQRLAGERASQLRLSPSAGRALLAHDWPLNVRELNQALSVALALAQSNVIDAKDLPATISGGIASGGRAPMPSATSEVDRNDRTERFTPPAAPTAVGTTSPGSSTAPTAPAAPTVPIPQDDEGLRTLLLTMLETHGGNITDVSRALGKTRMQIHRWMKRFEIDPTAFRR